MREAIQPRPRSGRCIKLQLHSRTARAFHSKNARARSPAAIQVPHASLERDSSRKKLPALAISTSRVYQPLFPPHCPEQLAQLGDMPRAFLAGALTMTADRAHEHLCGDCRRFHPPDMVRDDDEWVKEGWQVCSGLHRNQTFFHEHPTKEDRDLCEANPSRGEDLFVCNLLQTCIRSVRQGKE